MLICRLSLPAIELNLVREAKGDRPIAAIRRFLRQHIPHALDAQEGGSFVISAEVRAKNLSLRRMPLCRWKAGDSLDAAVDRAADKWHAIEKEEWPGIYEQRIGVIRPVALGGER
jgi:hypothetical protein